MKNLLFLFAVSTCAFSFASEKPQAAHNAAQEVLPLIMIIAGRPDLRNPVLQKYAWGKQGNGWKGVLLPEYRPNPQLMPEPQL